jgi:hypothetical protein
MRNIEEALLPGGGACEEWAAGLRSAAGDDGEASRRGRLGRAQPAAQPLLIVHAQMLERHADGAAIAFQELHGSVFHSDQGRGNLVFAGAVRPRALGEHLAAACLAFQRLLLSLLAFAFESLSDEHVATSCAAGQHLFALLDRPRDPRGFQARSSRGGLRGEVLFLSCDGIESAAAGESGIESGVEAGRVRHGSAAEASTFSSSSSSATTAGARCVGAD